MNVDLRRNHLPQTILAILPLLLFFPIAIVYAGVFLFMASLVIAGEYRAKWMTAKQNPLFWPVLVLLAISWFAAVVLDRPEQGFWSSFGHYQTYLFLLLFISVGGGAWQDKARHWFFAGAIYAASLYYLSLLKLLPAVQPFTNYVVYNGNKSILLGILLAIAASWMLAELMAVRERRAFWWRACALVYVSMALLFLAKTRTGVLIFLLLCVLASIRYWRWTWRSMCWLLGTVVVIGIASGAAGELRTRALGTFSDVMAFSQGHKISEQGNRLEIYTVTSGIIAEKPLTGHGIGSWEAHYIERARARGMHFFSTPHNEYLLYATEMGLLGMAALLWVWLAQLAAGWKMGGEHGMRLMMVGIAMMVGGMFNAILRDAVFGMAFMVLLAIPLAGSKRWPRRPG